MKALSKTEHVDACDFCDYLPEDRDEIQFTIEGGCTFYACDFCRNLNGDELETCDRCI